MIEQHFYFSDLKNFPYSDNYGTGFKFKLDNLDYEIQGDYKGEYRKATFSTHSYVGYGGIHYYGSIKFYTSNVCITPGKTGRSISGYLKGIELPEESKTVRIDILRPLELKEINEDKNRWEYYKEGDLVNAFYNEEDILKIFKECVNQIFKGKWIINTDLCYLDDEEIIIDN